MSITNYIMSSHRVIVFNLVLLYFLLCASCSGQHKESQRLDNSRASLVLNDTIENPDELNENRVKTFFPQVHTNLAGMVGQFVRVMFQDKESNFWFGTNGDGVVLYNGKSLEKFDRTKNFMGTAIRGIVEDEMDNVWLGTSSGLYKYDGNQFTSYTTTDGLVDDEIWDIMIDHNGLIWIATVEGVSHFDGKEFTTFDIPQAKVENAKPMLWGKRVTKMLEDSKGNLWFAVDGYGISIYDGNSFTHLTMQNGLTDNNVADLLEDEAGNIWIGTFYGGMSSYDGKEFTNYTKDGLIEGVETYNLCEDKNGNIWFSVENIGVYRFDGTSFTKFSTEDGLATNGIQSIFEDQKGLLWFGTWEGISIYNGKGFYDASSIETWTK